MLKHVIDQLVFPDTDLLGESFCLNQLDLATWAFWLFILHLTFIITTFIHTSTYKSSIK